MRRLEHLGPALVTLAAAGALLLGAPVIVRQMSRERVRVQMAAAESRLAEGGLLETLSRSTRDIAMLVEPSVVHVSTSSAMRGRPSARTLVNSGSGWIFDLAGHVVTNAHVVDGAQRIEVQLHDGERREAELVGQDLRMDIAVLRVDPSGLVPARRAPRDPEQGEMVFAFGSPFDFRFSMSSGIVSGIGRAPGLQDIAYENYVQTDAAVNPGNSGGPLTDIRGDVVGMTTAIASGRGGSVGQSQFAGIGLAIPVSVIENVVGQLLERGEVVKGFLGIASRDLDPMRRGVDSPDPVVRSAASFRGEGAVVSMVTPGSPAEAAGLKPGDVVTSIGGRRISSASRLRALIAECRPGDGVAIEVWRPRADAEGGEILPLRAVMARLDPELTARDIGMGLRAMGLNRMVTCSEQTAAEAGVPHRRGVLVQDVAPGSVAEAELPEGTVIVGAFGAAVNNLDDLFARLDHETSRIRRRVDVPLDVVRPDGSALQVTLGLRLPVP